MITRKTAKILGLQSGEVSILNSLKDTPHLNASLIALTTKIPRTTVNFMLGKLTKRNLVNKIRVGGHYEWQAVSMENMLEKIQSETDHIGSALTRTYIGKKQMGQALLKILQEAKSERLYFIQGNSQAEMAVSRIEPDFLFKFHALFKKQKNISEGIAGEKVLMLIKKLSRQELLSHMDRMLITHLLPDKFMDQITVEIYVVKNSVYIADHSRELIIQIAFEPLASTFKAIINYIKENTRSTNLNAHIVSALKATS